MQSPQLPIELCERIIDCSRHTVRFGDAAVDYATLRACTLVCSAWLPRARHNLILSVAVKSTRSLRDLAAGAARCAWIRPRELQLTLPLRLSRTRTGTRAAGSGSGSRSGERPRDSDTSEVRVQHAHDDDDDDANISLVHPAVAPVLHAVSTLTLVRSEWLFPPRYIALFGAQLRDSLRELRLHNVFFVAGRDVVQLLWSFPGLRVLDCFCAIVKFGDVATARLPPRPGDVPVPCSSLGSLKTAAHPPAHSS
ncbi:hypothetical protein OH76DRAFT_692902 [Lentinus brumalis]|uniref:F-box domain-containing protein n=1 Tax=Lentinus brumalis TaxID=2498619 RepID=A0A371D655_9APHY|nr:hypothetical protein OH76DRAFT_692902 [Polyporus brumalis]